MENPALYVPDDVALLQAELLQARAELAAAEAQNADALATITHQKLVIAKLQNALYGPRSERSLRLVDQMELAFEDIEIAATEAELASLEAAAKTTSVEGFVRTKPARNAFPEHLPCERVVVPGPVACDCCGGERLRKLGEDITETLEVIPRQWKVIQHVREKFTCRDCDKISQAPAPFHAIPRAWAGPSLLAMILFEKFGQHQPLNCQVERYEREGVPIALSTVADAVGACCHTLKPLIDLLEAYVFSAQRLHGDDTTTRSWPGARPMSGEYVRDAPPLRRNISASGHVLLLA